MALSPAQARERFRAGLRTPTAAWSPGYAQANLVVLPRGVAFDFMLFAQRNPKPCPVLDVTDPGCPVTSLAPEADLRTDLPAYRVWEHGRCVAEATDVTRYWRDDLVAFLIGCSFTFERALMAADVPVFWACGVTPQVALARARPPFAITHAPGHMFITDVPDESYAI